VRGRRSAPAGLRTRSERGIQPEQDLGEPRAPVEEVPSMSRRWWAVPVYEGLYACRDGALVYGTGMTLHHRRGRSG
jgi:hypothetical protein